MKKTWKKVAALILVAAVSVSAAGCGGSGADKEVQGNAQTSGEKPAGGTDTGSGEHKDTLIWLRELISHHWILIRGKKLRLFR